METQISEKQYFYPGRIYQTEKEATHIVTDEEAKTFQQIISDRKGNFAIDNKRYNEVGSPRFKRNECGDMVKKFPIVWLT